MKRMSGAMVAGVAALACTLGLLAAAATAPARDHAYPRGGKVMARISIPKGSGGLAVGEGAVWAMSNEGSTLSRIDPTSNAVITRVAIEARNPCPEFPRSCGEAAAGNGAVWVARPSDDTVSRIDPGTNKVTAIIHVGPQPAGVAVSPGAIWVANIGGPTVSRIDPTTNTVVATIRIGPARACCSEHTALTSGGRAVWATVTKLGAVVRIDPKTNKVAARVRLSAIRSGQPCGFLAASQSAVWAAGAHCPTSSGDGVVTRIDARTNRPSTPMAGFTAPIGVALGFGAVWVGDLDAKTIDRVNPRTRRIVGRLPVGGVPIQVATGFGSVWVGDGSGRVLRIKPQR